MKKLCLAMFLIAAGLYGQTADYADSKANYAVDKNGGNIVGSTSTTMATDTLWDAAGDLAYGTGADTGARLAAGSATQLLHSGVTPSWSAVLLSADVTGLLPYANFADGAALSLAGRAANSSGVQASITCTAAGFGVFRESGSTIACGAIGLATAAVSGRLPLANLAVAGANSRVLGSGSAGSGASYSELTLAGGLSAGASSLSSTTAANDTIYDAKGDIVAGTGADTAAKVTVGSNGLVLTADSTATAGVSYQSPYANIRSAVLFEQEWCGSNTNTSTNVTGSGVGNSGNSGTGGQYHNCYRTHTVGTATGSVAIEGFNTNTNTVSNIESGSGSSFYIAGSFNLSSVGDGTDVVKYYGGGCSTGNSGDCNNGMYIRYDRSVSTTNWYLCAADNGSRTCTDTTIAVVVGAASAGNWNTFEITSNSTNNSLSCIINGTACATGPTTNLPGAGHGWAPMFKADKTAGATTTFTMNTDLLKVVQIYNTARTN